MNYKMILYRLFGKSIYTTLAFNYFKIKRRTLNTSEKKYITLIENYVKPNTSVLDIGANVGLWTMELSRFVKKKGRVLAFEPISETFKMLNFNCKNIQNVKLFNVALGKQTGEIEFSLNPLSFASPSASIKETENRANNELLISQTCVIDRMDNYEKYFSNELSFIKIDVEGHELNTILGGLQIIRKYKPVIFIEILRESWLNNRPGDSKVSKLLLNEGYSISQLQAYHIEENINSFKTQFENFLFTH